MPRNQFHTWLSNIFSTEVHHSELLHVPFLFAPDDEVNPCKLSTCLFLETNERIVVVVVDAPGAFCNRIYATINESLFTIVICSFS